MPQREVQATLFQLARAGRAMVDPTTGTFRLRELFAVPLDLDQLFAPDPRVAAARRLVAQGNVTLGTVTPARRERRAPERDARGGEGTRRRRDLRRDRGGGRLRSPPLRALRLPVLRGQYDVAWPLRPHPGGAYGAGNDSPRARDQPGLAASPRPNTYRDQGQRRRGRAGSGTGCVATGAACGAPMLASVVAEALGVDVGAGCDCHSRDAALRTRSIRWRCEPREVGASRLRAVEIARALQQGNRLLEGSDRLLAAPARIGEDAQAVERQSLPAQITVRPLQRQRILEALRGLAAAPAKLLDLAKLHQRGGLTMRVACLFLKRHSALQVLRRRDEVPRPLVEHAERAEGGDLARLVVRGGLGVERLRQIPCRLVVRALALGENAQVVQGGALAALIAHRAPQRQRLLVILRRVIEALPRSCQIAEVVQRRRLRRAVPNAPLGGQCLLVVVGGLLRVAFSFREAAQIVQRDALARRIARSASQRQRLRVERPRVGVSPLLGGDCTEIVERGSLAALIAQGAPQRQRLLVVLLRLGAAMLLAERGRRGCSASPPRPVDLRPLDAG